MREKFSLRYLFICVVTYDAQKTKSKTPPEFRHLQRFHLMDLFQKLLPHKEVVSGFLSSWQLKYSKTPKQKQLDQIFYLSRWREIHVIHVAPL